MSASLITPRRARAAATPRISAVQTLLVVHGCYYLLLGLWSVLDLDSFLLVTGPKSDLWLVRTVSVLLLAVAGCLLLAARKPQLSAEVVFVSVASAAGLTVLDVAHVTARVVSPVYLIDAAAQVALLLWWAWLGATKLSESGRGGQS